jgi:glycosyltransferase involved in cell wall biosynthesis
MSKRNLYEVSIIIPAYNEAETIGWVLDEVKQAMEKLKLSYEIIVIDDGSTDNTGQISRNRGVKIISHRKNLGSGASRKSGLLAAKGEIAVMLDADGTYSASDIPNILEPLPQADQVIGVRKVEVGNYRLLRGVVKWFIQRLASFLTHKQIPDLNSGLRAVKRKIILNFLDFLPDGFSCVSTMTIVFLMNGLNIVFIPCQYKPRVGKSKFRPIVDTYNYILTVIRTAAYFNTLRLLMPITFLLTKKRKRLLENDIRNERK